MQDLSIAIIRDGMILPTSIDSHTLGVIRKAARNGLVDSIAPRSVSACPLCFDSNLVTLTQLGFIMPTPLESLVATGTKLWLDSIDPDLVQESLTYGATGATSNPAIVSGLIKTGRFDAAITELIEVGLDDSALAWDLTDRLVRRAQDAFLHIWDQTTGDDGYVSFEVDPLLEDADCPLSTTERTEQYIEQGQKWAAGHSNRMIKVPATEAGLGALEELTAAGVTLNVTLLFTERQYRIARDAIWRGAQRRTDPGTLKSVYSIFVSRIDAYTAKHVPELSSTAQGEVAILNAKQIWRDNHTFWQDKGLTRRQEIIFASMGTKDPTDPADKYVAALAGSDIQTNPPGTNSAVQEMAGKEFSPQLEQLPSESVISEIRETVEMSRLEAILMEEGLAKFAVPQKELLALIAEKRSGLART